MFWCLNQFGLSLSKLITLLFIFHFTGKTLRRLSEAPETQDEMVSIHEGCKKFQFKGRGQQETTLLSIKPLIRLTMLIPGKNAAVMRSKFTDFLAAVFAGDPDLVHVLAHNNDQPTIMRSALRHEMGISGAAGAEIEGEEPLRKYVKTGEFSQMVTDLVKTHVELEVAKPDLVALVVDQHILPAIQKKISDLVYEAVAKEDKNHRKRTLNDAKTAEYRRDRERKHEVTLQECKKTQKKMEIEVEVQKGKNIEAEKTKLVFEEELRKKRMEEEEESRKKRMAEEDLARQKKFQEEKQHMLEMIELEKQRKSISSPSVSVNINNTQQAPSPSPVTVEQVAEMYKILADIPEASARAILSRVGVSLRKEPHNLEPVGQTKSQFNPEFAVNQYDTQYIGLIRNLIEQGKKKVGKSNLFKQWGKS